MSYSPLQMAEAFLHMGELDDALTVLNAHLEANPADEAARRIRASIYWRLPGADHQQAALADLEQITQLTAADYTQRSIIFQQMENWDAAIAAMEQARQLTPDDDRLTERYLLLLERAGRLEQARRVVAELPPAWRWSQMAGDLAECAGDLSAAVQHYSDAVRDLESRLDVNGSRLAATLRGTLLVKRAPLYVRLEQFDQAEADYAAAVEIFPKELRFALEHGLMLTLRGQTETALDLCRSVLCDAPELRPLLRSRLDSEPRLQSLSSLLD